MMAGEGFLDERGFGGQILQWDIHGCENGEWVAGERCICVGI